MEAAHRQLAKYPGIDVTEQDKTQAENPGGGLLGLGRAKDTAARRRDLKQRKSGDRKTGSEPDVLFNTRDDTVSAVSKSAPQVKVAKGTKGLRHPPGAPPSDPFTSLLPSGTDSEQGSRNSGESYVPTPQNSGSNQDPVLQRIPRRYTRRRDAAKQRRQPNRPPCRQEPSRRSRARRVAPWARPNGACQETETE